MAKTKKRVCKRCKGTGKGHPMVTGLGSFMGFPTLTYGPGNKCDWCQGTGYRKA